MPFRQRSVANRFELLFINVHCLYSVLLIIRWLGVRLEMIANVLILSTAVTAVFMRDHLTAGTVGLMITFALQITNALHILVRMHQAKLKQIL